MSDLHGFSARSLPFHSMPKASIVSDAPTAHDALVLAKLDWTVSVQPDYQRLNDGTFRTIPNRFLTVRDDTEKVLGNVGKVYVPSQNETAFAFADALLGHGIQFDAAGAYANDTKVFLTAKLPNGITVEGTDDSLDLYLLFRNSHDGSSAETAMVTPVRLACTNMMNLATKSAVSQWSCRHTASAEEKRNEAARTLKLVDAYTQEFQAITSQLRDTEVDLAGFERLISEVTTSERNRAGMLDTWKISPTVDRSTGWGAINAIGEYMEHLRGGRQTPDSRFDSNLDGQVANTRNRAVRLLLNR